MFASVAETYDTVDSDLLNINGIRVCKPSLMLSSFKGKPQKKNLLKLICNFQTKISNVI